MIKWLMSGKLRLYCELTRVHRPAGSWLLLWPCWWGITLSSTEYFAMSVAPDASAALDVADSLTAQIRAAQPVLLLLFLIGAVIMRSAGCVINDLWDRKIDREVERTKHRPLASGQLSTANALGLLAVLLSIGLMILLQLNAFTICLGLGFSIMVLVYPLMKRIMRLPQLFLAVTFNAGALMGFASVQGNLSIEALILYFSCFFWTLGYDTIYAHQDKKDDARIGIHSSALCFGKYTRVMVGLCYASTVGLLLALGEMTEQSWPYYAAVCGVLAQFSWQVLGVNLEDPVDCRRKFTSNAVLGWLPFLGIIGSQFIMFRDI